MAKKQDVKKLRRRVIHYYEQAALPVLIKEAQDLGLRIPKAILMEFEKTRQDSPMHNQG